MKSGTQADRNPVNSVKKSFPAPSRGVSEYACISPRAELCLDVNMQWKTDREARPEEQVIEQFQVIITNFVSVYISPWNYVRSVVGVPADRKHLLQKHLGSPTGYSY